MVAGPVFPQQLMLLDGFDLRALGHNSVECVHTMVEAAKLAFADRERYYGDPDFVPVPMRGLLSAEYAAARRATIDPRRASLELRPGDPYPFEGAAAPPQAAAIDVGFCPSDVRCFFRFTPQRDDASLNVV